MFDSFQIYQDKRAYQLKFLAYILPKQLFRSFVLINLKTTKQKSVRLSNLSKPYFRKVRNLSNYQNRLGNQPIFSHGLLLNIAKRKNSMPYITDNDKGCFGIENKAIIFLQISLLITNLKNQLKNRSFY